MPNFAQFKTTNASFWKYVNENPAWWLNFTGNAWDSLMDAIAAAVATFVPYAPAGTTTPQTVGASPWTYTAGSAPEIVYISGGAVSSVTRNGVSITNSMPLTVLLPPGGQVVITFTIAPLVVVDK